MSARLTKSAFGRLAGVSHSAIDKAIKKGHVVTEKNEAGRERIDPDHRVNYAYLHSDADQRHRGKLYDPTPVEAPDMPYEAQGVPAASETVEPTTVPATVNPPVQPLAAPPARGYNTPRRPDNEEATDLAARKYKAQTEKIEQQAKGEALKVAKTRGELVSREQVYNRIMAYIDKLHANFERLGSSYLSDFGALIIDAGEVTPEHRSKWQDAVMGLIDETKRQVVDEMKRIAREGA